MRVAGSLSSPFRHDCSPHTLRKFPEPPRTFTLQIGQRVKLCCRRGIIRPLPHAFSYQFTQLRGLFNVLHVFGPERSRHYAPLPQRLLMQQKRSYRHAPVSINLYFVGSRCKETIMLSETNQQRRLRALTNSFFASRTAWRCKV